MIRRTLLRAACVLPVVALLVPIQGTQAAPPGSSHAAKTAVHAPRSTFNSAGLNKDVFGYFYGSSMGDPNVGYTTWNFDLLSTVAFFAIHIDDTGVLVADSSWTAWNTSTLSSIVSTAHAHGVKVVVTLKKSGAGMCNALYNWQSTVDQTIAQVQAKGVDGVNIDYEGQLTTCTNPNAGGTNYTNQYLIVNLAAQLRSALNAMRPGLYLSIATYSGSATPGCPTDCFFDLQSLNQYVDAFFVMAYDMDYANQGAGPLGSCTPHCMAPESPLANYYWNDSTSMSQYSAMVGASKTILGQPYYGTVACVSSPVAHAQAQSTIQYPGYLDSAGVISSPDVQPGTYAIHRDADDPAGMDRWDTWYDLADKCWKEMYWSDTTTLSVRYDLVNQDNLRGVGFWTLPNGGGASELWDLIRAKFVACSNTDVAVSPATPQLSGTSIQLNATTSFCASPEFAFYLLPPGGSWQQLQAMSSNASYTWSSLGRAAGTYWISIWALGAQSPGLYGYPGAKYDSYKAIQYTLTTQPCTSLTASASPTTALMGTTVTVTGVAGGCPAPSYLWWLRPPGQVTWNLVQGYTTSPTLTWDTHGQPPGSWGVAVWARDRSSLGTGSNIYGSWDRLMSFAYNLTTQPCTGVTASPSVPSPELAGTPVTLTGTATGCPGAQYQFEMQAPGSVSWQVVQPYSTSAAFPWKTAGAAPGVYRFIVKARDTSSLGTAGGGNPNGSWDAYTLVSYTLTSQPCGGVTSSASASGATVTVSGAATGCPNPEYQFEVLAPGSSTWRVVQQYSPSTSFAWSTTGAPKGTYRYIVKVRDASSPGTTGAGNPNGAWDAYSLLTYTLT